MSKVLILKASDYPIKSVTVFKSSKAEVVRTFSVNLSKGQNKIEIKGLSSSIDTHSVRVSGLGDGARLYDVVCTIEDNQSSGHRTLDGSDLIHNLSVKETAIESRKAVREAEAQLLLNYARSLKGKHISPVQMAQFLDHFVSQINKNIETREKLDAELLDIQKQIAIEEDKCKTKKGAANGRVDVVIATDDDGHVDLTLTYIVNKAKWQPTYELHAETENGKPSSLVKLHYRARVSQATGEDWNNTSLTLSTVSRHVSGFIPRLGAIKLQPGPFPGTFPQPSTGGGGLFGANKGGSRILFGNTNANNQAGSTQVPSGSLFGSSTFGGTGLFGGAPATQTTVPGGLFAQAPQQQQQAQQQALAFGQQQQQAPGFGQQQQQAPAFGQQQQQPPVAPAAFGFGGFGGFGQAQATTGVAQPTTEFFSAPAFGDGVALSDEDDEFEDVAGQDQTTAPPEPMTELTTIVNETPVSVTFGVQGEATIPSDGVDHQVAVAILPFEAAISYIAVPRVDPRVYLQCHVKNTSDHRLLPGPVMVIFDDSFVSSTSINDINTGENFDCTLGDDPSTKVSYSRKARTVKSGDDGPFVEATNTTTYTTKIVVHNKHQFTIDDLIVRDVVPTCEDKRGRVVLRKPDGLASAKDGQVVSLRNGLKVAWGKVDDDAYAKGGRQEGLYEWKWKVEGGAKVTLEAEWDVKVPGDHTWAEAVPRPVLLS